MDMALKLGKPVNPNLHVGICGEHGGDPSSVEFCHKIGLDYVSCSPFRVPIARLAAAQAAIANVRKMKKRKYFYFTTLIVTRDDVNEYMKYHAEYTKANRFKDIVCKIYLYITRKGSAMLPFLISLD